MEEMRDFWLTFIVKLFSMGPLYCKSPNFWASRDESKEKEVKGNDEG